MDEKERYQQATAVRQEQLHKIQEQGNPIPMTGQPSAKQPEPRYWSDAAPTAFASPMPVLEPWPDSMEQTNQEYLWVMRKIGIGIRNWTPRNADAWLRWDGHYKEWLSRLEQALRIQNKAPLWRWIECLNMLEELRLPPGAKFWSAEQQLLANCLHTQLARLEHALVRELFPNAR